MYFKQLVENEELIGTLIETNERIIASLQMYDMVSNLSSLPLRDVNKKWLDR